MNHQQAARITLAVGIVAIFAVWVVPHLAASKTMRIHKIMHEAQRTGIPCEMKAHTVTLPDGRQATIYSYGASGTNGPTIVFEDHGDRVFVRAVKSQPGQ